jgi:hypothetical protein
MSGKESEVEAICTEGAPQQAPGAQQQVFSLIFHLPYSIF